MINKCKTKRGQSVFDILDHRPFSTQMICNLSYNDLEKIYKEIEVALLDEDVKRKTKNGVHPHYGKIE